MCRLAGGSSISRCVRGSPRRTRSSWSTAIGRHSSSNTLAGSPATGGLVAGDPASVFDELWRPISGRPARARAPPRSAPHRLIELRPPPAASNACPRRSTRCRRRLAIGAVAAASTSGVRSGDLARHRDVARRAPHRGSRAHAVDDVLEVRRVAPTTRRGGRAAPVALWASSTSGTLAEVDDRVVEATLQDLEEHEREHGVAELRRDRGRGRSRSRAAGLELSRRAVTVPRATPSRRAARARRCAAPPAGT